MGVLQDTHFIKMTGKRGSLEERFWTKVTKTEGCWKWSGTTHKGYGQINPGNGAKNKIAASRASWMIHFGAIPKDMHVLHRCDNPGCTNPKHLFLGTHADNMLDKERKKRGNHPVGVLPKNTTILNEGAVRAIRELRRRGMPRKDIAAMFGVTVHCIADIIGRRNWSHVA